MKLLLYSWNANNERILADNLIREGFEVMWFHKECKHYTRDMALAMEMIPFIHAQGVEAVISFNYFPILSMICHTCQIPYYSWVYDCPHFTLYAKQVTLSCNHIGIFDREMVKRMEDYGVHTVYHVPLSVDTACFNDVIGEASRQERERFRCDISFVGSLYTDGHNYYDRIFGAKQAKAERTKETRGPAERKASGEYLDSCRAEDAAIFRQRFSYHQDYLRREVVDGGIDLPMIQAMMEKQGLMLGEDYAAKPEDILLAAVLEKKVTVEERRILLTETVRRFACDSKAQEKHAGDGGKGRRFDFRLYTGSDTRGLPELDVLNCGMVDYRTQMPLVFAGSRINLNISLRSIHSGIPLRVLDIMACGGFVLSNWQPEISENFEEGVEIVTFNSLEDCLNKIEYFLTHEEERRQIAAKGQAKVRERFSYQVGLAKLFR